MAILAFKTSTYARNIFMLGVERFTAREGFSGIPAEYIPYVKQYAATKYYIDDIQNACIQGWISDDEMAETLALKGPDDPQYRPLILAVQEQTV